MSAVKFETFSLDSQGETATKQAKDAEHARERDEAYAKGFKDGVNVTNDAIQTMESDVAVSIQEALSDVNFSQKAASQIALAAVSRLVAAFCQAVAPNLAKAGLAGELGELVSKALKENSSGQLLITHHPSDNDVLLRLLGEETNQSKLVADHRLKERQVTIAWEGGFDNIEMDEAIAKALIKINDFTQLVDKEESDERSTRPTG